MAPNSRSAAAHTAPCWPPPPAAAEMPGTPSRDAVFGAFDVPAQRSIALNSRHQVAELRWS